MFFDLLSVSPRKVQGWFAAVVLVGLLLNLPSAQSVFDAWQRHVAAPLIEFIVNVTDSIQEPVPVTPETPKQSEGHRHRRPEGKSHRPKG